MKNTIIVFKTFCLLLFGLALMLLQGCPSDKGSPWDGTDLMGMYENEINGYFDISLGKDSKVKSGNQDVYVDFSDGLYQAYSNETNANVVKYISQKLVGANVDWYGLGKDHGGVGKLEYANDKDIYNKVVSRSSYVDIMAPIEEALKKISVGKNDALLVTDFEEYSTSGKEETFAYPKKYFTSWVEAGNSITFYYSTYTETNTKSRLEGEKNLYFVIFSYGPDKDSPNSLLNKFNLAIAGQAGLSDLKKFEINPNNYNVYNEYGGKDFTGLISDDPNTPDLKLGDKAGVLESYQNGTYTSNKKFEALEFGLGLEELYKYYFEEKGQFTKDLFLDASKSSAYTLESVKVQVTDVTDDYTDYIKSLEAVKSKPTFTKDAGNNQVWDEKTLNNPIIVECYEKDTDKLKNEYVYTYKTGNDLKELFDFDKEIFADHLKNSPDKIELITTFHKNYTAGKIGNSEPMILRIDYIIDEVKPNINQLNDFKWNSIINKDTGTNASLSDAIRSTIQDVKPKGILYSYYLKLEPTK